MLPNTARTHNLQLAIHDATAIIPAIPAAQVGVEVGVDQLVGGAGGGGWRRGWPDRCGGGGRPD